MSGPVTSVARVEDVQIFLKDPVFCGVYMCASVCLFSHTTCSISVKLFIRIWLRGFWEPWIAYSVWWLGFGLDDEDIVVRFPTGTKDFSPLQSFHTGLGPTQSYFLGAFTKFHKTTITLVISVRSSAWNNSAPNGRISMRFYIQSGPKKCIHSLLINIFGINLNEISISGWECNIMFSQQMAQALL